MSTSNSTASLDALHPDITQIDYVHFGTDGWRAIIDEDFNPRSVARVARAAALVFKQQALERLGVLAEGAERAAIPAATTETAASTKSVKSVMPVASIATTKSVTSVLPATSTASAASATFAALIAPAAPTASALGTILLGYDCRLDAGRYAALAATVIAAEGFDVCISDRYCPTPALCWTIARDPNIIGGLMMTSSHNPAEYLGIKLRMIDGGASPAAFTDEVEAALCDDLPACFDEALNNFGSAVNGTQDSPATTLDGAGHLRYVDIMTPYLGALRASVDAGRIRAASLRVVLDPMYGAGRGYLAEVLRDMGVEVVEVNGANDPTFNGLHPEPILPWVQAGVDKVRELGFDACVITDGDADRIGAVDGTGAYVTSHLVLSLIIGHLVENQGQRGRVVRTLAGSNLLRRQCDRLGLTLTTRPIGFKWIYEEMLAGDVLIGGEESGGMGIPTHVRERDGLLMALLIAELMAIKGKKLQELVDDLLALLGTLKYSRRDLRLTQEQKDNFLCYHVDAKSILYDLYQEVFDPTGESLVDVLRGDGVKFSFASDAWLLIRPSGTEPLVRVYAEAATDEQVQLLLDLGCRMAQGS